MQVRILGKFEYIPCLIVIMEMNSHFVIDMPEAF